MNHRPSFRTPRFKPAAKLAFVAPPKVHLFMVEIMTGRHAGHWYTTTQPMTRQQAYDLATECYGNERPLITLTVIDPTPVHDPNVVPVWFVEKLMAEKRARITAEAAEAARQAALPIPPMPAKRNLFTLTYGGPALVEVPSSAFEWFMPFDELTDGMLTTTFEWTADEMGFNAWGYRSGFSVVS